MTTKIPESVMVDAEYRMWVSELDATKVDEDGKRVADWFKRRVAACRICEIAGIADLIRAISLDGQLRPPPKWPEVDIVPCGGGPGFIACEIRTLHDKLGVVAVSAKIVHMGMGKVSKDEIGECLERGKWELRKMLNSV